MSEYKENRAWVLYSIKHPNVKVYVYFNEWGELKWGIDEPYTFEELDVWVNGKMV